MGIDHNFYGVSHTFTGTEIKIVKVLRGWKGLKELVGQVLKKDILSSEYYPIREKKLDKIQLFILTHGLTYSPYRLYLEEIEFLHSELDDVRDWLTEDDEYPRLLLYTCSW